MIYTTKLKELQQLFFNVFSQSRILLKANGFLLFYEQQTVSNGIQNQDYLAILQEQSISQEQFNEIFSVNSNFNYDFLGFNNGRPDAQGFSVSIHS